MDSTEKLIDEKADLEKRLAKSGRINKEYLGSNFVSVLVLLMTFMAFSTIFVMFFVEIPEANKDTVYLSIGIVLNAFALAIGYIFGRSKVEDNSNYSIVKTKE